MPHHDDGPQTALTRFVDIHRFATGDGFEPHRLVTVSAMWTRRCLAVLGVIVATAGGVGCSASTANPTSPSGEPSNDSATTTIVGFDFGAWAAQNRIAFDEATSAMGRFADAVEVGEVQDAQDAASEVRLGMSGLAATLETETRQAARDLRNDLIDCGLAYGAIEDALANSDADALNASMPLFSRCLGIANVTPP